MQKIWSASIVFLLVVSVGFVGCKEIVIDELTLNITTAQWLLEHGPGEWDSIELRITGDTNGDRVTIMTYGDGVRNELELTLDANKQFNQVVTIQFSYAGYYPPVQTETTVTAYHGSEFKSVKLYSGLIW